jgi:ketohexokinase
MARILAVGIATLDIVNEVEVFPAEDSKVRARAQSVRRGGNATNTLAVLSQLGHDCEWAGISVNGPDADFIRQDLGYYGIGTRYCRWLERGKVPTSYITLNRSNGSRTIVHYRDLPEFDFEAFRRIPLPEFDWLHFEGRDIYETLAMMRRVRETRPGLAISLEVEKARDGVETLFSFADLILLSPAVAGAYGCKPDALLREVRTRAPDAELVCTLGSKGAIALSREGEAVHSDASPPPRLVDTIAAGDAFNAAMIDMRQRGASLAAALRFACRLAGNKCGQAGLRGLNIPRREI